MRVNIAYSVDIEEVPAAVGGLISEAKEKVFVSVGKKIDHLLVLLSQENEKKVVKLIDEIRHDLAKMDVRLLDCGNIIEGYQQAISTKKSDTNTASVE